MFVAQGFNVDALRDQILVNSDLFDTILYRKEPHGEHLSPHRECFDIHLRYNDLKNQNREDFHTAPYTPVWYEAAKKLPDAVMAAIDICRFVGSEMLGSVFIFKLPPGKKIYPHKDLSWNSTYFDKFLLGIQCDEKSVLSFEDNTSIRVKPGEIHKFENNILHSVDNESDKDWIVMVVNCRPVTRGFAEDLCLV